MSASADSVHRERQGRALRNRNRPRRKIPARSVKGISSRQAPAPVSSVSDTGAGKTSRRRRILEPVLFWLLMLVQAGLLVALIHLIRTPLPEPDLRTDREMLTLRLEVSGESARTEEILYGETVVLPSTLPVEGQTFLGWLDEEGRSVAELSFPLYRNAVYTADLIPAFETRRHIPYLQTDEEAVLDVDGPITRREFVNILYLLLDTDATGQGRFMDVAEDDPCFDAAAYLKDLGILTDSRLHPDANLSCGELLETLCRFFPAPEATEADPVFQDLEPDSPWYPCFRTAVASGWIPSGLLVRAEPDEPVSRGRFARIMNHVLGRDAERHLSVEDVGTILDVPPSGDFYDDVVEAVIPHEYRMHDGVEVWTSSEALPVHEPGFFFTGVRLHFIDEDGTPAVNTNVNGLDYNRNGEVTSGDSRLDRQLWAILEETIDPKTMTREEMLRAVYDHVVDHYSYRYGSMYAFGAEGWAVKEARRMLEYGSGNCYCYAALFYELARFVGYDAKLYSGRAYGEQYEYRTYDTDLVYAPMGYTPHGWVEIEFDGVPYIFDTEYEYRSYGLRDMFMGDERVRGQYGYVKAEAA